MHFAKLNCKNLLFISCILSKLIIFLSLFYKTLDLFILSYLLFIIFNSLYFLLKLYLVNLFLIILINCCIPNYFLISIYLIS